MVLFGHIALPSMTVDSLIIMSVFLAIIGTLFLAYELLGRENGPLRWFTFVITCGLVSALVLGTIATVLRRLLNNALDLNFTLQALVIGGLMGFFTVILIELPPSKTRPPILSRKGSLIGLALGLTFVVVVVFILRSPLIEALAMGVTCAVIVSVWQRVTWEPSQAASNPRGIWQFVPWEESSPSNPNPRGSWKFVDWEPPHPKPPLFSRKRFLLGLGLGFICWFVVFFITSRDITVALLESVPLAFVCGVISSAWRFITWEPIHPKPHLFSRKGFLIGLVAGFVPWLIFNFAGSYQQLQRVSGPREGFEAMISLSVAILLWGGLALSNATAGSIAQYTLWRANSLPHRTLGAFGLVLLLVSFGLQGVQPLINILNGVK
jgi:hypothetical protein